MNSPVRTTGAVLGSALISGILNAVSTAVLVRHLARNELESILMTLTIWMGIGIYMSGLQSLAATGTTNIAYEVQLENRSVYLGNARGRIGTLCIVVVTYVLFWNLNLSVHLYLATLISIPLIALSQFSDGLLVANQRAVSVQLCAGLSTVIRTLATVILATQSNNPDLLFYFLCISFLPSPILATRKRVLTQNALRSLRFVDTVKHSTVMVCAQLMMSADVVIAAAKELDTGYPLEMSAVTRAIPFTTLALALTTAPYFTDNKLGIIQFRLRKSYIALAGALALGVLATISPLGVWLLVNVFGIDKDQMRYRVLIVVGHSAWAMFMFLVPLFARKASVQRVCALAVSAGAILALLNATWSRATTALMTYAISGFVAFIAIFVISYREHQCAQTHPHS